MPLEVTVALQDAFQVVLVQPHFGFTSSTSTSSIHWPFEDRNMLKHRSGSSSVWLDLFLRPRTDAPDDILHGHPEGVWWTSRCPKSSEGELCKNGLREVP